MLSLQTLNTYGQSAWLNYLRRAFLESGELGNLLEEGLGGITSTQALFAKAISHSSDYDDVLLDLLAKGKPIEVIHEMLVIDDMQRAADGLHPVHEATEGLDGYVSVELDPAVIDDAVQTAAAARHLLRAVDRGNAMIEIPATPAGIEAIRELTSDGVCINVTHVFSLSVYEEVAAAYLAGLEQFFETHTVWRIAPSSVVSFSLNRIDRAVDEELARLKQEQLQGRAAISLAKMAYGRYQHIFSGPRWETLARRGGRPLRLKWTRTTPRNFAYPDLHYVEALIGPDTVMTFSPVTLNAFRQRGVAAPTLVEHHDQAQKLLVSLAALGIDLEAIATRLQQESLAEFRQQYQDLLRSVRQKQVQLQSGWQRMEMELGGVETAVADHITTLCRQRTPCRLWSHDHELWQPALAGDQLGWLHIVEAMRENLSQLQDLVQDVHKLGFTHVVLLGMGGATLPGHVLAQLLQQSKGLTLHVLDSINPHFIRHLSRQIMPDKSLFIVADKKGETFETLALFRHFYNLVTDAVGPGTVRMHFAAITDNGSPLHTLAGEHRFRHVFLNDPYVPEAFGALSYFGLVPAVLAGVDVTAVLDNALAMAGNASSCNCPIAGDNLGGQLGAVLAALVETGRDKLTFITPPELMPFTRWVEYLLAAALGKEQKGLVPVVGEPLLKLDEYGSDRAFVYLQMADEKPPAILTKLKAAGYPVITLRWQTKTDAGGQFFLWQIATVIAAHLLNVNPFYQPNTDLVRQRTQELLDIYQQQGRLPPGKAAPINGRSLDIFLAQVRPGDYITIQAYVPPTAENDAVLQDFCTCLRQHQQVPAMVSYGPAYLHTTAQLYQGGPRRGYFLQLTTPLPLEDVHIPDAAGEPGTSMSFGVLNMAQALADGQVLARNWRHMMRFHLVNGVVKDIRPLVSEMS